ncbi:hypothetical protein N0V88_007629 [Collariella sp. IMI 366227]|nr:hypothetical protein N0V88_007629 [Collariella sp. IMI 366227]
MPALFPMPTNPALVPVVQTRKALLILDLQNDFLTSNGALYTEEPDGYVDRILELAKAFRDSGNGDVIWIRSEFERHCSLLEEGEQIVTSDSMVRPEKAMPRGRSPASAIHDCAVMEADEEAFLSIAEDRDGGENKDEDEDEDKRPCVRKGTRGAELVPKVKAAIDFNRDIVFTKNHYSAFNSAQQRLVLLLRTRFVTQLYVCGALTNISIYATALDAGRHGYGVTIIEDCCGFRSPKRHINAVRQLKYLGGCDDVLFESLIEQLLSPPLPKSTGLSPSINTIDLDPRTGELAAIPAPPRQRRTKAKKGPRSPADRPQLRAPPSPPKAAPPHSVSSNDSKPKLEGNAHVLQNLMVLEVDSDYGAADCTPALKLRRSE